VLICLPKSSAKVNNNITTIQQIKIFSINVHGTLTKAEQAELLGDCKIVLKAAAAHPSGPLQLSASAPAADDFQTAQSPPRPYDDTLPVDNSH
jgi:hypothetical protein